MSGPSGVSFESTGAGFSHFVPVAVLGVETGVAAGGRLAALGDAGPGSLGWLASGGFI